MLGSCRLRDCELSFAAGGAAADLRRRGGRPRRAASEPAALAPRGRARAQAPVHGGGGRGPGRPRRRGPPRGADREGAQFLGFLFVLLMVLLRIFKLYHQIMVFFLNVHLAF